jgi:maleamate amidohydrolase
MSGDSYTQAGYGAVEIALGARPAVLVVDLQTAFTEPRYPLGGLPRIHAATDRTAALLAVAKQRNVPVAACYTAYHGDGDQPHWKVQAVRTDFRHGHPCTAIDPRIAAVDPYVYCKGGPSMFFQTPLITWLVRQNIDTLLVTGCTTSGCVRATVVDGFSYGFRIAVVDDCCGDADEGPHRDTLRDVGRRYATIIDCERAQHYLRGA